MATATPITLERPIEAQVKKAIPGTQHEEGQNVKLVRVTHNGGMVQIEGEKQFRDTGWFTILHDYRKEFADQVRIASNPDNRTSIHRKIHTTRTVHV